MEVVPSHRNRAQRWWHVIECTGFDISDPTAVQVQFDEGGQQPKGLLGDSRQRGGSFDRDLPQAQVVIIDEDVLDHLGGGRILQFKSLEITFDRAQELHVGCEEHDAVQYEGLQGGETVEEARLIFNYARILIVEG